MTYRSDKADWKREVEKDENNEINCHNTSTSDVHMTIPMRVRTAIVPCQDPQRTEGWFP